MGCNGVREHGHHHERPQLHRDALGLRKSC
jgi:hypothetical protein